MTEKSDYGKGYEKGSSGERDSAATIFWDSVMPGRDKSDAYKEGEKDGRSDRESKK